MDPIIKQLSNRLKENNIMDKVLNSTSKAIDIEANVIKGKSRKYVVKLARMVSSNIMMNEYNLKKDRVGPYHNRDRSLMYHYQHVHDNEYVYWTDYQDLYDLVHKEVTNGAKFKNITKNQIRFILLKHKICNCKQPTHKIKGKIANKTFTIKVRHDLLFDKLEEINKAFSKFEITVTYKDL